MDWQNPTAGSEALIEFMLRLRGYSITDSRLLNVVETIPHKNFLPIQHYDRAWLLSTVPIDCGQTLYAPDITIRMVEALRLKEEHRVLEIGTGSGYQTALLAKLSKKVHTLERYQTLIDRARIRLEQLEINNVTFEQADANNPDRGQGLYDRMICDVAFEETPRVLLDQLVAGGIVVTAIGMPLEEQMVVRLTKIGSRFEREDLFPVRFGSFERGIATSL